jgi:hypothetical protein
LALAARKEGVLSLTSYVDSFTYGIRRRVFEARVAVSVSWSNAVVERAFKHGAPFPVEKVAAYSGAGMAFAILFLIFSYWSPNLTSANIAPTPNLTAKLISPATSSKPVTAIPTSLGSTVTTKFEPSGIGSLSELADLPKPSLSMEFPVSDGLYTFVVDKTRKELFVLEENKDNYKIISRYKTSLGSASGDKKVRGDNKTPEGLYRIVSVKQKPELPGRYGPMAFVLDYPNKVDRIMGKTGDGIWIHGSGLGERTEQTEGCIEINDKNILKLAEFVENGATVYVFPENFRVPVTNNAIQKNIIAPDTLYALKEKINKLAGKF